MHVERFTWSSLDLTLVGHALGDPAHPPLVLLHGFLDQGRSFLPVARLLTERYRVILPDHRGHGLSPHAGPGASYHFPDYVLDLAALVDHLGLEAFALAGHSMGASIAVYYAGAFPARVQGLALLDGIGPAAGNRDQSPAQLRHWMHDARLARQRDEPPMADLEQVVARLARAAPRASLDTLREVAPTAAVENPDGTWRWRFDPLLRTRSPLPFDSARFLTFLDAITCPALAVWGQLSPFPPPDAEARAARLPDATSYVMAGIGHNLHHERPLELAGVLRGFFDEVVIPASA